MGIKADAVTSACGQSANDREQNPRVGDRVRGGHGRYMTCIVGFTDKKNGASWIGGDSLGSNGYTKATEMSAKVFRNDTFKNVLFGGTTTFRHLDLLRYSENLFDEIDWYKKTEIDHKYMVTKFIPRIIDLFKGGVVGEAETNRGSNFIVATPGKLFEIQSDYSVLEPELGICSVGCGESAAMGSLLTTKDMEMSPVEKITKALEAAETYCCGVQRPFRILCTDSDEEIIIR